MRILNVVNDERFGGPPSRILQVAVRLKKRGVETVVAMPDGDRSFAKKLKRHGIRYRTFDLVRPRSSLFPRDHIRYLCKFGPNVSTLREIIAEEHIDLIHTNGIMNLQPPLSAALQRVSNLWHLNSYFFVPGTQQFLRSLVKRFSDLIALAAWQVGNIIFDSLSSVPVPLRVLYAPVDTDRFRPDRSADAVREELDLPPSSPVIACMANLQPSKGVHHLLEATGSLVEDYPDVHVLVIGKMLENHPDYSKRLKRIIDRENLDDRVHFTGFRNDVPDCLAAADLYVHPSLSEACPMAVLEASATGLPVVATNVGGTRELIQHGSTGFLVPPNSPEEISSRVARILDDPGQARKMGKKARKRMKNRFSLTRCVNQHLQLYRQING